MNGEAKMQFSDFVGWKKVLDAGDAVSSKVDKALLYLTMGLTLSGNPHQAQAESTAKNSVEMVDPDFKFDIVYDTKADAFLVKTSEGNFPIFENDLNYKKWQQDYNINLKETFAEPTKIDYVYKDAYEHFVVDKEFDLAHYKHGDNTIKFYNFHLKEENRESLKKYLIEHQSLSEQEALNKIDDIVNSYQNIDVIEYQSIIIHESSHRDDEKFFANCKTDLPAEYMAKLDMMTEIKANMAQAGFALQYFKKTGDLKAFDYLACDMSEVKEALTKEPNMKNPQEFIALSVYNSWLKTHNQPHTNYSGQAAKNTSAISSSIPLFAYGSENVAEKEFQSRCKAMLKDVPYLGDVSKSVKVDFELNKDLKLEMQILDNPRAKVAKILSGDAEKAKSCAASIMGVLNKVKGATKDGIITEKEQKGINNAVQAQLKKSHSSKKNSSITPATIYYANQKLKQY